MLEKRSRRAPFLLALGSLGLMSAAQIAGCQATAIYDAPDPLQCESGNGCPMAICQCGDGSFMIDSTCETGKCHDAKEVCADRCVNQMGVIGIVVSKDDNVAIPACDVLGKRMQINGCGEGTALIASDCADTSLTCSPEAAAFWKCVVGEGVLSCKRGALHVLNCADNPPALCNAGAGGADSSTASSASATTGSGTTSSDTSSSTTAGSGGSTSADSTSSSSGSGG